MKRNNNFHIKWDEEYVEEGCPNVTVETLDTELFNKNVESGWRVMVDDKADEDHDDSIFSAIDGYVKMDRAKKVFNSYVNFYHIQSHENSTAAPWQNHTNYYVCYK